MAFGCRIERKRGTLRQVESNEPRRAHRAILNASPTAEEENRIVCKCTEGFGKLLRRDARGMETVGVTIRELELGENSLAPSLRHVSNLRNPTGAVIELKESMSYLTS